MKHYQPLQSRNSSFLVFTDELYGQFANNRLIVKWIGSIGDPVSSGIESGCRDGGWGCYCATWKGCKRDVREGTV